MQKLKDDTLEEESKNKGVKLKNEETPKHIKFWETSTSKDGKEGAPSIVESKLIQFLNQSGFGKTEISETDYVLVEDRDNIVREISDYVIVDYVKKYLEKLEEHEVLEEFVRKVSTYVSKPKLRLLQTFKLINDRDTEESSWFFFKNICCQVDKNTIKEVDYKDFQGKIWSARVINNSFSLKKGIDISMFEKFCKRLANQDEDRFLALQTNLGYVLHRYHDPANPKAWILVDEKINFDGTANGGTGKSLLLKAVSKVREVVVIDGKNIKGKSWYKNQRINRTTDVVLYDDVTRDFNMETIYSMLTSGIPIEKKYKAEEYLSPENSPKITISSNYMVQGTGGNTDVRRRAEFEVHNYYNLKITPESEFKCLFFTGWENDEWSRFYHFMMTCVQKYLEYGLIIAEPINLKSNRLIAATSPEFIAFMSVMEETDAWIDKRTFLDLFIKEYVIYKTLSSHQFTKWLKEYAKQKGFKYSDRSTGGKYEFMLETLKVGKEATNEEE
ncbi:hypothetical protein [Pseudotamlana agarivorans]|uniref:hypothetical protein n=1 Tax=Pseudotamlana agarivorans TaxID=481183 RepID=UPI0008332522|nr:hypothetical protein [Tamlana agarivorans]